MLNYYAPYVSGLTLVAQAIAEGYAAQGRRVRVVTSRYDRRLPRHEVINGVTVERTRVVARVRNGVVSPGFPFVAALRARRARVAHLHLPMLEAGLVALATHRRRTLTTYQCDYVTGDPTRLGRIIRVAVDLSSRIAFRRSAHVVVTSDDYARASRVYRSMGRPIVIAPPFTDRAGGTPTFRESSGLHVGTLGRVVHEKGLDVLIRAVAGIDDPEARLLIAGHYAQGAGPTVIDDLRRLAGGDERIRFLGYLADDQVADFLASLDVFAFPSVNALEAYGIAQLEAISAGVPVVASDLPGVRLPVTETGFGALVDAGDVAALRAAIRRLPATDLIRPRRPASTAVAEYVTLIESLAHA